MCKFPLEPSYSKSLITSKIFGVESKMIALISLLSSENLWAKPPRINEDEYKDFEKKFNEFMDLDGDHETLLKVMKRWERNSYSEYFCKQNYLNSRALMMAENIKV